MRNRAGAPTSPFTARTSPYAALAELEVRTYLRRCGLLRSTQAAEYYDASGLGLLTAQVYPDALRERLLLIARWFCVWTVFDDQLERLPDTRPAAGIDLVAERMLGWLDRRRAPGEWDLVPFATGFGDAWADIRVLSSPDWQRRFLADTRLYLAGCRWEADNRAAAAVPDLLTYIAGRRRFGGIRAAMDLVEFGGGYELADRVHIAPPVQELLDVLGDITLWSNDLFSVTVDREEGNVSNLVFVLQRDRGCGPDRAMAVAAAMLEERLARLLALEGELRDWAAANDLSARQHADLSRYVAGAHAWISGNIAWSAGNPRYVSAQHRVDGAQPNFLLALVPG